MKAILIKEWEQGDVKYEVGQLLEVDQEGLDQLISRGLGEEYKPKAYDRIVASPVDGGLGPDDIKKLIKDTLKETSTANVTKGGATDVKSFEKGGYDELWQFARDVYKSTVSGGFVSEKLQSWNGHIKEAGLMEGSDMSQGGALVPTEFRNQILEIAIEDAIIRQRAMQIPMATSSVRIPYVKDASHAASTHGGIIIYRPDEGAALTASNATYGNVELNLHKLAGLVHVTTELLEDSPISMQPLLTRQFGEAIGFQEDEDFINGTGAGMSLGALNAPALISVAQETDQPADTIVTQNLAKMWSRLHSRGQRNAVWLANLDTFPQFYELTVNVGTGGSIVGIIGNDITGAPIMQIMGRPLILTEHMQTIGDKGDVLLADWSQYLIGSKAGSSAAKFASSIHLKFDEDKTSFRFIMRVDGQPWNPTALTPKHSTITLSSFVTLDARTGA